MSNTTKNSFTQFLQDTLDTLFGILDESSQRYGLKVFDSLVSCSNQSVSNLSSSSRVEHKVIGVSRQSQKRTETHRFSDDGEGRSDVTIQSFLSQSWIRHAAPR